MMPPATIRAPSVTKIAVLNGLKSTATAATQATRFARSISAQLTLSGVLPSPYCNLSVILMSLVSDD